MELFRLALTKHCFRLWLLRQNDAWVTVIRKSWLFSLEMMRNYSHVQTWNEKTWGYCPGLDMPESIPPVLNG
jgi:hypothetical protein